MRITKKQRIELDFFRKQDIFIELLDNRNIDEVEKEYLNYTVYGKKNTDISNPFFQAKRHFDITVKMWTDDLRKGILLFSDLEENKELYIRNIAKTLNKKLEKEYFPYRQKYLKLKAENIKREKKEIKIKGEECLNQCLKEVSKIINKK